MNRYIKCIISVHEHVCARVRAHSQIKSIDTITWMLINSVNCLDERTNYMWIFVLFMLRAGFLSLLFCSFAVSASLRTEATAYRASNEYSFCLTHLYTLNICMALIFIVRKPKHIIRCSSIKSIIFDRIERKSDKNNERNWFICIFVVYYFSFGLLYVCLFALFCLISNLAE